MSDKYRRGREFRIDKERELVGNYFSVLKLCYKQSLIKQKKATNLHKKVLTSKSLHYLHFLAR